MQPSAQPPNQRPPGHQTPPAGPPTGGPASNPIPGGQKPGSNPHARRFGRFGALDVLTVALYLALPFGLAFAPLDRIEWLTRDPQAGSYTLNLISYGVLFAFATVAARRYVTRDLAILRSRPWFTLGILPLLLVVMLVVTAIVSAVAGGMQTSVNQDDVQSLTDHVPWYLTGPLLVVLGPFVEEYIFRHLMIGKLSRYVNRWLCCAASVVLFAGLHLAGKEAFTLAALAPYLGMGLVLVFSYVWSGNNLMFSYFLHALKNLLSVVLLYSVDLSAVSG